MKQNRRVRSLLLKKQLKVSSILTVFFCILGGILCGGAILLLLVKSPTLAADGGEQESNTPLRYKSIDDKVEVLNRLSFTLTGEDGISAIVAEMYQDGKNLYVVPKPLIVNLADALLEKNSVGKGVWGNILGGYNNEVNSDNITIVGGKGNKILSGNRNATVLGGKENLVSVGNESPMILIGGKNNVAEGNKGVSLLLGGSGNKVINTENTNIVLGENNIVTGGSNVIVGGLNVSVGNLVKNVFVFSDGVTNFSPENGEGGSDTFYLQVQNGLGLNVRGQKGGVESKGAVGFGTIDISKSCSSGDLGLEGAWNGCLVGCTSASMGAGNAWEMLDQGENCINQCGTTDRCISLEDVEEPVEPYTAFCSTGVIWTGNAYLCTGAFLNYKNVVFETALIDSYPFASCPNGENKCIYQCNSGFRLTGDVTGRRDDINGINSVGCYNKCKLPWKDEHGNDIYIEHNETVIGYDSVEAKCSVPNLNFGSNALTAHEHCGDHKATLVCSDGTLYVASGVKATDWTAQGSGYKYEHCDLQPYTCDTSVGAYHLTRDVITGALRDQTTGIPTVWTKALLNQNDGKYVKGKKGVYKLCINYMPDSNPDGEKCNEEPEPVYNFRLVDCNPGYSTGVLHPGECRLLNKVIYDYKTNGGSKMSPSMNNVKLTYESPIDLTPTAEKSTDAGSWEFLGWNTDPNAHEGLTELTMPDEEDVKLYALFKKQVQGKFNENGSNVILTSPTTGGSCIMWNKDNNCTFTGAYTFERAGWIVDGWNTDKQKHEASFGVGETGITISKDTDFYTISHKPLKAMFYPNGATSVSQSEVGCDLYNREDETAGCKITTPTIERDGWTPLGWHTNLDSTTALVKPGKETYLLFDIVYYAITQKELTASFDPNETVKANKLGLEQKSWESEKCKKYNQQTECTITLPSIKTKDWYSARGWTTYAGRVKNDADVLGPKNSVKIQDDKTFYAQVTTNCSIPTVTYDYATNGGTELEGLSGNVVSVMPQSSVDLTPKAKKSGWNFKGWATSTEGVEAMTSISSYTMGCSNVTLYAIYSTGCTAYFDENGAKSLSSTEESCTVWNTNTGCSILTPMIFPLDDTRTVSGFSEIKNDNDGKWLGNQYENTSMDYTDAAISCGKTYYAQTKTKEKKRYITFDLNGNKSFTYSSNTYSEPRKISCTIPSTYNGVEQSTSCKTKVTFPTIQPAEGKTVIGWSTAATKHTADYNAGQGPKTLTLESDITFYAQSSGPLKRTVFFENNDHCTVDVKKGECTVKGKTLYNAETDIKGESCEIIAPSFTPASKYQAAGYDTDNQASEPDWLVLVPKSISSNDTYYCITRRVYSDCDNPGGEGVISHGDTYTSYETDTTCGTCSAITAVCDDGDWINIKPSGKQPTSITSCTSNVCPGECNATHYGCKKGESINNGGDSNNYTWQCKGTNGGKTVNCSESKGSCKGRNGETVQNGTEITVYVSDGGQCCLEEKLKCKNGDFYDAGGEKAFDYGLTWDNYNCQATGKCGSNKNSCSCGNVKTGKTTSTSTSKTYHWQCLGINGGNTTDCEKTENIVPVSCFVAGTQVTMADGTKKNIEEVKIGEKVLGQDGKLNTVLGYDRPVLGERHLWSINGSEYFVSDEHPFMTTEGWKSFNPEMTKLEIDLNTTELKVGDILVTENGLEEIRTVDYIDADYDTPLYNLVLDGDHTYHANSYLVHNKSCFIAGTKVIMADGTKRNIEDVKAGEKIKGEGGENTVLCLERPILEDRHLWSINGSEYFVSDEHPFMTTEGWKSFNPEMTKLETDLDTTELKVGDILITNNGLEEIKTVDYIDADYDTPLYNFILDGDNTYYVKPNGPTQVGNYEDNEIYELTINGKVLKASSRHPFYVKKSGYSNDYDLLGLKGTHVFDAKNFILLQDYEWVETRKLNVGDVLLMINGDLVEIEQIKHYPKPYENHDYSIDWGYLVHNKSCFVAGTQVTMADGSEKNIEDVKIGEKVLGSNGTVNTVLSYDRPLLGNRHLWSINGSKYFVSDEHPFMTTEGWKSFNPEMTKSEVDLDTTELKVGDMLVTNNGLEEIKTVDYIDADYDTPLYNLVLDGDHTYHANGYLVHNKGDNPGGSGDAMSGNCTPSYGLCSYSSSYSCLCLPSDFTPDGFATGGCTPYMYNQTGFGSGACDDLGSYTAGGYDSYGNSCEMSSSLLGSLGSDHYLQNSECCQCIPTP